MNYHNVDTTELINKYFEIDMILEGVSPGCATLSDMTDVLMELDTRGVCARTSAPPEWYIESCDFGHNTHRLN